MKTKEYSYIIVESYKPKNTSGLHGEIHIKPIAGQEPFTEDIHVSCSKRLSEEFPVGTKFRIKVKLTKRKNGKAYAFSYRTWPFEVVE